MVLSEKRGAGSIGLSILRKHGVRGLAGAAFNYATRPMLVPLASRSLQASLRQVTAVEPLVDVVLGFRFGNISVAPMQVRSEIVQLCQLVAAMKPSTVLEIGTAKGGTLCLFANLADPQAQLVSVDLPLGQFGGGYPRYKVPLYRSFAKPNQRIELLRGDSHAPETYARVEKVFAGRGVDFLFIDGDHSFDGVAQDFEMYSRLVRPGGLVAFHDVVPGDASAVGEVPRFWRELKLDQRVQADIGEYVADWKQGGLGIGVLRNFRGKR